MENLKALKERLQYEIKPILKEKKEEEEKDNNESEAEGSYEYRNTTSQTKGRVRMLEYDVDYRELMDFLLEEVPNISWTVPKARQVFKAIKKYLGISKTKDNSEQ